MSEQPEVWYIPGDEISIDLGTFEHQQHLLYVVAVYADASNTENAIELHGDPEPAGGVSGETPSERWFNSRATVSTTIEEDRAAGRYWFQGLVGRTYGEEWVEFERSTLPIEQ